MSGQHERALEIFKKIEVDRPNDFDTHLDLANSYQSAKRFNEAITAFKLAVSLRPDEAIAHFGLGTSYLAIGNTEEALKEYEVLKELNAGMAEQLLRGINKIR